MYPPSPRRSSLALDSAAGVATAEVRGRAYLFATGYNDDRVSVFRIDN